MPTGFNVTACRWMPLSWYPEARGARISQRVSAGNQANLKRLRTLLEYETREAVSPELTALEALTTEVLRCVKQIPPACTVTLAASGATWVQDGRQATPNPGTEGRLRLFLNPEMPYEVEFFADVRKVERLPEGNRITAVFAGCSAAVAEIYQQLVFIYCRAERLATRTGTPA